MIEIKKMRHKMMEMEALITEILTRFPSARNIEAIPILIAKNICNPFALFEQAIKHDLKNQIGYLLEISLMLKKDKGLVPLLDYLRKNKDPEERALVDGDTDFLRKTSPPRVKKWNLLGRFFDDDFRRLGEVYL
jgi:hypothetical protein